MIAISGFFRGFCKAVFIHSLLVLVTGCGGKKDSTGEFYTNWDIAGGCVSDRGGDTRPSAAGTQVNVCDDVSSSSWIWVSYAAPWCTASKEQAPVISSLLRSSGSHLAVYKVLTSGNEPFVGATSSDIRAWARSYKLPADSVLAEKSTRVLPQHLLIGPDGRTWYRYIGYLSRQEIETLIDEFESGARMPNIREIRRH